MKHMESFKGRYTAAVIIITLGVLLLLSNLDLLHFGSFIGTYWPSAIIIWALYRYFTRENRNVVWTLTVVLVMAFLQAGKLGWLADSILRYWPMLLVLLGFNILMKKPKPKPRLADAIAAAEASCDDAEFASAERQTTTENTIDCFALFTSMEKVVRSPAFSGGEASAIFGQLKVDLGLATPTTGDMFLKVTAIFGETVIRVPTNWNVSYNITPVFGGAEDIRSTFHTAYQPSAPMLHITGSAVFGAVKLKN